MISTDKDRLNAYFRSIYEHSRQRMPRNLKTPEAAAMLEEFEEGISVLVDRLALRLHQTEPAGTQATRLHEPIGEKNDMTPATPIKTTGSSHLFTDAELNELRAFVKGYLAGSDNRAWVDEWNECHLSTGQIADIQFYGADGTTSQTACAYRVNVHADGWHETDTDDFVRIH